MKFRPCPACHVVLVGDDQYACRPCCELSTVDALRKLGADVEQFLRELRLASRRIGGQRYVQ